MSEKKRNNAPNEVNIDERDVPDAIEVPEKVIQQKDEKLSWEEKGKRMLESIDKKVEILAGFKELLDSIELSEPHKEVKNKLKKYLQDTKKTFPERVCSMVNECNLLIEERKNLLRKLDELEKSEDYYSEDADNTSNRLFEVLTREKEILDDSDTVFLVELENVVKDLIKKNKYVKSHSEDRDFLIKDGLRRGYKKKLSKEKVKDLTVEPFNVIYTIKKDDFKKDYPGRGGFYVPGTSFIFIIDCESRDETEKICEHERVHNILDSLDYNFLKFNLDLIKNYFKEFENLNLPDYIRKRYKPLILKSCRSSDVLNGQHEEILAAMRWAKERNFFKESHIEEERIRESIFGERDAYIHGKLRSFDTAGNDLKEILRFFDEKGQTIKDKKLKSFCSGLSENIKRDFLRMVKQIEESNFIAQEIGEKEYFKNEMLFSILKPSQYGHIKKYFEFKNGKEKVEDILFKKKFIESKYFSLEFLKSAVDKLENRKMELSPEQKIDIFKNIMDSVHGDPSFFNKFLISVDDVKEYNSIIDRMVILLEIPEEWAQQASEFKEIVFYNFCMFIFEKSILQNEDGVLLVYDNLNEEEKELFKDNLKSYIGDYLLEDLANKIGREITKKDIKKCSLWKVIQKTNLNNMAINLIE